MFTVTSEASWRESMPTINSDEETVSFETKNLGRFVLTDKEIADGTIVDESFVSQPETKPESKILRQIRMKATSQTKDQLSAHPAMFRKAMTISPVLPARATR